MIEIKKQEGFYAISYIRKSDSEICEMTKYDLEHYEIGQLMGGN